MALNCIINCFKPDYIAQHALVLTQLIKEADSSYPKHSLFATLGT